MTNPFNKPYIEEGTARNKFVSILLLGLFIFLFLFFFKPFGLSEIKPLKQLTVTFGFGIVTTFMLIIFKFLIQPMLPKERQTLGRDMLWALFIAVGIGIANYVYVTLIFNDVFEVKYLLFSVWTSILVGSIPVTINYMIAFNRKYRSALEEADIVPERVLWEPDVIVRAGNPKNEFRCNPAKIVYLSSNDNYVTIVTNKDDVLAKTHLRGTLKAAEGELKRGSRFFRCHKCFIINSDYVDRIAGNARNMKIVLTNSFGEIPVSRTRAFFAYKRFRTGN